MAWQRLQAGNQRFALDKPAGKDIGGKRRAELAKGQRPFAVVLTCADSRVAPELVFDQGLGELFVLRVAGNIADPAVVGSVEYAVASLQTPLVVVLGHSDCGAVEAAVAGKPLEGDLGWLIKQVYVGSDLPADKGQALTKATEVNVKHQLEELMRRSPALREFVEKRRVKVVSGVYTLTSGKVSWLEEGEEKPKPGSKRQ
jgi:carbonic anhydrase